MKCTRTRQRANLNTKHTSERDKMDILIHFQLIKKKIFLKKKEKKIIKYYSNSKIM